MYFPPSGAILKAPRNKRLDALVESKVAIDHPKKKKNHSLGTTRSSVFVIHIISCPRTGQKRGFSLCGYQHETLEDLFGLSCIHVIFFLQYQRTDLPQK